MNAVGFNEYKEQFLKEKFFSLVQLDDVEIDTIPKSSKSVEYEYLKENGIINKDGIYFRKKSQLLSNEEIALYTNMETVHLFSDIVTELQELKEQQKRTDKKLVGIIILLSIISVVLILLFLIL